MFPYPISFNTSAAGTPFENTKSLVFDGVDDYVVAALSSDAIIDFSNAWSISWWAKWDNAPTFDL